MVERELTTEECELRGANFLLLWFGFGAFLAFFVFMEIEVVGLFVEEALRLVGEILARFNRIFAGKIEWGFAGEGAEGSQPVLRFVGESSEGTAHVGVAIGVLVEVGSELVHQRRDIVQFVVEAVGAGVGFVAVHQALDGVDVVVEEFGVELDALVRIDAGFANFFDLGVGEGIVARALCGDGIE